MNLQLRRYMFWGVCMPLRSYITLSARSSFQARQLLRLFALAVSYRWLQGLEVGNEGMFGDIACLITPTFDGDFGAREAPHSDSAGVGSECVGAAAGWLRK